MHPYFISYSHADGTTHARRLRDALQAGTSPLAVWWDEDLRGGASWDTQLNLTIRDCKAVLYILTTDSANDLSVCKNEYTAALDYRKHVIPLKFDPDAKLPFLLNHLQYIDFTADFDAALTQLREDLDWRDTPAGEKFRKEMELMANERAIIRAKDDTLRRSLQEERRELQEDIARLAKILADPAAAAKATAESIEARMALVRKPIERPKVTSRIIYQRPYDTPHFFQDRLAETVLVGDFLKDPAQRLLWIIGRGGIGKTALSVRVLEALERNTLPDTEESLDRNGIVYLSKTGTPITVPNLWSGLLKLLPTEAAGELDALYRDPKTPITAKIAALLPHFREGRTVVLLDNFEDLLDDDHAITEAELDEALRAVLDGPAHGLKFIITTRRPSPGLLAYHNECQNRYDLEHGLRHPHAENVLRTLDQHGALGLRDRSPEDDLLQQTRERLRGHPKALVAVHGALMAQRGSTLEELLQTVARIAPDAEADPAAYVLPQAVLWALVGEAFSRLDAAAQQVMQALAIFGRAVPPVAVDMLLQPFNPTINSASILLRLVNMHFVEKAGGEYGLHPDDQAYALGLIPGPLPASPKRGRGADSARHDSTSGMANLVLKKTSLGAVHQSSPHAWGELEGGGIPFTQRALYTRAADYFRSARKPREQWKTLDDLAPQLAEIDLRCKAGDYDTAARVLLDIDFDYLLLWGHFRVMMELHERLQGKIEDAFLQQTSIGNLGTAYRNMGQVREAIRCYERALQIARDNSDRWGEGAWLGNLGNAYANLGEVRTAIDHYQQALAISRDIGDKRGQGNWLGNLGGAYYRLGEVRTAIDHYQQALAISRDIGDKRGEGSDLGNLGLAYAALGEVRTAIDHYQQALAIYQETGSKPGERINLGNLGLCYAVLGDDEQAMQHTQQALQIARDIQYPSGASINLFNIGHLLVAQGKLNEALPYYAESIQLADDMGFVQSQVDARLGLAEAHLHAERPDDARQTIDAALQYDYPTLEATVHMLKGTIALRQGQVADAREAFTAALAHADEMLAKTAENYRMLDMKALACCGLALTTEAPDAHRQGAMDAFQAARAIIDAAGVVRTVLRRYDALALADTAGGLGDEVRNAAGG